MGQGSQTNHAGAREYRTGVGNVYSMRWARSAGAGQPAAHAFHDYPASKHPSLVASAKQAASEGAWRATMDQAEAAWFGAQPTLQREGIWQWFRGC